jgi:acyl dehydratase
LFFFHTFAQLSRNCAYFNSNSHFKNTMNPIIINSHADLEQYVGKEIGVSDYLTITQHQIDLFAESTLDHQWIHVDAERCANESPFKKTIAHGYLNLSVLPYLWEQIVDVRNSRLTVNYGIEKLRFIQAVTVDSEVRVRCRLNSLLNLKGISKAEIQATLEIKDSRKPAFEATIVFLYHFV